MKVAVLGSGAMGSLFGGLLAESGFPVTLIDIWEEHVTTIQENGLRVETPEGTEKQIQVDATTDPATVGSVDLLLVFVKSIHTSDAIEDAELLLKETDVLTLQNGLGNPEMIAEIVPEERILAGITSHGSTLLGPGRIRHAGRGETTIGRYFVSNDERTQLIARRFSEAGIPTGVTDDITETIWEKILVNVGINAPTALAGVKNGLIARTESGTKLAEAAIEEAVTVAEAEGHEVRDDIEEHVLSVAKRTADNKSSMLQDIEDGRKTEIETLNGEIVRRAERLDVDTPVNRTLMELVQLAERGAVDRSEDG